MIRPASTLAAQTCPPQASVRTAWLLLMSASAQSDLPLRSVSVQNCPGSQGREGEFWTEAQKPLLLSDAQGADPRLPTLGWRPSPVSHRTALAQIQAGVTNLNEINPICHTPTLVGQLVRHGGSVLNRE